VDSKVVDSKVPRDFLIDSAGAALAIIAVFLGAYALPEGDFPLSLASAILMLVGLGLYFRSALLGRNAGIGRKQE
jgi:hypothetical protein